MNISPLNESWSGYGESGREWVATFFGGNAYWIAFNRDNSRSYREWENVKQIRTFAPCVVESEADPVTFDKHYKQKTNRQWFLHVSVY